MRIKFPKLPRVRLPRVSRPKFSQNIQFREVFRSWLPFAVVVTLLSALVFVGLQQSIRAAANDPQTEYAEDLSNNFTDGAVPDASAATQLIDIEKSLGTYIIVLDENLKVLLSTATVDGKSPVPPDGVMNVAKDRGRNMVTWQPKPGVRSAIVVNYYHGTNTGYVIVGRSLRESEARINTLLLQIAGGWIVVMLASLLTVMLTTKPKSGSASVSTSKPAVSKVVEKPLAKTTKSVAKAKTVTKSTKK